MIDWLITNPALGAAVLSAIIVLVLPLLVAYYAPINAREWVMLIVLSGLGIFAVCYHINRGAPW